MSRNGAVLTLASWIAVGRYARRVWTWPWFLYQVHVHPLFDDKLERLQCTGTIPTSKRREAARVAVVLFSLVA
jgi:hypothetical protein